jgi:hypothetical protein
MEVLSEVDLAPADAVRLMTEFAEDPFLSERDPERARTVQRVSANLALTAVEIDSTVPAESPRRRKRHHSSTNV